MDEMKTLDQKNGVNIKFPKNNAYVLELNIREQSATVNTAIFEDEPSIPRDHHICSLYSRKAREENVKQYKNKRLLAADQIKNKYSEPKTVEAIAEIQNAKSTKFTFLKIENSCIKNSEASLEIEDSEHSKVGNSENLKHNNVDASVATESSTTLPNFEVIVKSENLTFGKFEASMEMENLIPTILKTIEKVENTDFETVVKTEILDQDDDLQCIFSDIDLDKAYINKECTTDRDLNVEFAEINSIENNFSLQSLNFKPGISFREQFKKLDYVDDVTVSVKEEILDPEHHVAVSGYEYDVDIEEPVIKNESKQDRHTGAVYARAGCNYETSSGVSNQVSNTASIGPSQLYAMSFGEPTTADHFECVYCEEVFTSKATLINHIKECKVRNDGAHPQISGKSNGCSQRDKEESVKHNKFYRGLTPYSCSKSGEAFNTKSSSMNHLKFCREEKLERSETLNTEGAFKIPVKLHSEVMPYNCAQCDKTFKRKNCLRRHNMIHTKEKSYKCSLCDKAFRLKGALNNHFLIHSAGEPLKCEECGKTFRQIYNYKSHQMIHSGEKPYSCSQCKKAFRLKSYLKAHSNIHSGNKPYTCQQCAKSFRFWAALKAHQVYHSKEKLYSCAHCMKTFKLKCVLKLHILTHSGNKPYSCEQCGKSFIRECQLKRHSMIHSGEKPHRCSQCEKSFRLKPSLDRHVVKHSAECYKCLECGKTFTHNSNLKRHQAVHSDERPHKCSVCDKTFRFKGNLKEHFIVHCREKPNNNCSQYGKTFTQGHLNEQLVFNLVEKPFGCAQCGKTFRQEHLLERHLSIHTGEIKLHTIDRETSENSYWRKKIAYN